MNGRTLTTDLRQNLSEVSGGTWMDDKQSYQYLYDAALKTADRTNCFTASTTITTVASTSAYDLPADFLKPYMANEEEVMYLKYSDGTSTYWLAHEQYNRIFMANNTTAVLIPSQFTIKMGSAKTRLSSTTTADGAASNGECTLTNAAASFLTTVSVGDIVSNVTDGSDGVVIAVTDATHIVTCLFGGTANDWTNGDSYFISPQTRFQLILDPPPSTSGHTVTVPYIQAPAPVFSPYRAYPFAPAYKDPLVAYATWKYKYRDSKPDFGDRYYQAWELAIKRLALTLNQAMVRPQVKYNFLARR